ncbi:MAG: glycosyltransferase family 4 protein [Bradyrhizobiaceae bacterium]|nr:glycosyltransferase family 4 protein [Hyphomicrobiales bacterium]MBV9430038.1 glycosyltransferase family 4 protein [Bradyrhizobiaceae bacterium]
MTAIEEAGDTVARSQRPLRVTLLGIRGFPNVQGGAENHAEHLATELVALGCEVEAIVRTPYVAKGTSHSVRGIKLARVWSPRRTGVEAFVHTFLGVLRAACTRPDILHIHSVGPALFTPLARFFGLKVVVTHHLPNYEAKKWGALARAILRLGERLGMRFANGRIAVSAGLASRMKRTYGVPVAVIPNGIAAPSRPQSTSLLHTFGLEPRRYILTVARIDEQKRQLDLIDAFGKLGESGWKLAIVGDSDYATEYARRVRQAAAQTPGVVLLGYQASDALAELYTHAGFFVLPSSHEGQPIAALEAISFRCPTVLSDIPAHREIGTSVTQFVRVGDVAALARSLRAKSAAAAYRDPGVIEHEYFMKNHDWREIAARTLKVYMSALSQDKRLAQGLVSRFRSSPQLAARSEANFGIEGH